MNKLDKNIKQVCLKRGQGYWDTTKYRYGGNFGRITGDKEWIPFPVIGTDSIYSKPFETKLFMADGTQICIDNDAIKYCLE